VRIFGIDPGSVRTGWGCVESDGSRHHLVSCGAIATSPRLPFPDRLLIIHSELRGHIERCHPDCVAIEAVFYATNARSALQLGHARGVALLAATEAGLTVAEYAPAEVKRAVVGYGRAEKLQVQQMVQLLLGIQQLPGPYDVSDALAVAICHVHSMRPAAVDAQIDPRAARLPRRWRDYKGPKAQGSGLK